MVDHVVFLGAVRDISGDFVNVLAFRSGLRTGKTTREIELRVDTRVLVQLLKRIGPGAIRSPRTITKVIEDLLVGALSSRNCGFDPLRVSQWEWEKQRWPSYHAITFHKPYRGLALSLVPMTDSLIWANTRGDLEVRVYLFLSNRNVCQLVAEGVKARLDQTRSKRSRFITLFHAATKSFTNFSLESAHA